MVSIVCLLWFLFSLSLEYTKRFLPQFPSDFTIWTQSKSQTADYSWQIAQKIS